MRTKCVLVGSLVLASLALADEAYRTDSVVITATGFETDADSNLRNVIVISSKDLEEKGYTSIEEALTRQAGISFTKTGIGMMGTLSTGIDMRGQGSTANFGVKVMVDGITTNTLDNGRLHAAGVALSPLDSIAIEDIERIEIIPGGGAVLYGNGTRGGAINIITKKSKESAASFALGQRLYDNSRRGTDANFAFSGRLNERLSYSTNLTGFKGQGYRYGDEDTHFYSNSKIYYDINDKQSLNLGFAYFMSDLQSTGPISWANFKDDPDQKGSPLSSFMITRPELNLDYKISFNKFWDLSLAAYWQRQRVQIQDDDGGYYDEGDYKDSVLGANLKARLNYMRNSYLIFGYGFERHESITYAHYASRGPKEKLDTDDTKDAHSVFALISHEFAPIFALSAGARYEYAEYNQYAKGVIAATGLPTTNYPTPLDFDKHSNNYALELTPTLKYSNTGKIYLKYERGYTSPTPYQFRYTVNSVYMSNPYIESETYDTGEVGLSDYLFGFLGVDLAAFYTLSHDEILGISDLTDTAGRLHGASSGYYNIDKTRRYGVELNLRQDFSRVSLYENFAFIDAEISSGEHKGKRVPLVPRYKANVGVDVEVIDDLRIFANGTYNARVRESFTNNDFWINDYFLVDLGARYEVGRFSFLISAKNIFDKQYALYQSSSVNSRTGIKSISILPADGRSYYAKIGYKF